MKLRKKVMIPALLIVVFGVGIWVWMDYRSWLALGPGGVPYNLDGWAQVTWMRLWKHDPLDTSIFEKNIGKEWDVRGLGELPKRGGDRPHIDPHPIPHRQKDQFGDEQMRQELRQIFDREIADNGQLLIYEKSHFERRNDAVWLREPNRGNPNTRAQGEVAHIHPSDGSMHMTLSPSDAKKVIEAGWGELHSLADDNGRLPATYTMIYSPRSKEEVEVAEQILEAAVKYAAGSLRLQQP
jgi:hypothetical protein